MAIKPEDVRRHLEAKRGGAAASAAAAAPALEMAGDEAAGTSVAAAAVDGIIESISASYFLLRRGLAALAFAFPILLWLGAGPDHLQASISAYYHYAASEPATYGAGTMRNLFVGVLWAIGAFLFFYKGYSWKENWTLDVAGLAALAISLFPMDWPPDPGADPTIVAIVHQTSAVVFFLAIAGVCLFLSDDTLELMNDQQRKRRFKRVYVLLGALMVLIPLGLVLLHFLMPATADRSPVVFFVEAAAIYVFAAFWLVKSREIKILEEQ